MLMQLPKVDLPIRPGTKKDIPFIDGLQKKYNKNLGFLQTKALEGKIALDQVLVAESSGAMVGYIIAQDRYFKRDELGMICQLVVAPDKQRGFIGAALLKAQFERSAYGCRLYCCWCAQDLAANHFWESMGFVPLAFRTGSEKKARVHIFWEKKIRGNDDACNWWFPSKTDQGLMRADRIVFPIRPGVHWSEVKPVELPKTESLLVDSTPTAKKEKKKPRVSTGTLMFAPPSDDETKPAPVVEKPKREKTPRVKVKADPKFIAAARELRDRYLEGVNERGYRIESAGKYDVSRMIAETPAQRPKLHATSLLDENPTIFFAADNY